MATAEDNKTKAKAKDEKTAQGLKDKLRIMAQIKSESLTDWKGQAPSYEHFPV